MKATITFIGTNPLMPYLHGETIDAEIIACSGLTEQSDSNMHIIKTAESEYLFDIKDVKVLDSVILSGILQDEDRVGRVAIKLS